LRRLLGRRPQSPWHGSTGFPAITEAWNGAVFASAFGASGSMVVFGGGLMEHQYQVFVPALREKAHLLVAPVRVVRRDGPQRLLATETLTVVCLLVFLKRGFHIHHALVTEHQADKQDGPFAARVVAAVGDPQVVVGLGDTVVVDAFLHESQQQSLSLVPRIVQQQQQGYVRNDVGNFPAVVGHVLQRMHLPVDPLAHVVEPNAPVVLATTGIKRIWKTFEAERGKYKISIDTSETPDLTEWAHKELAPVLQNWYPKIVKMLPSEGYQAPGSVRITFSPNMRGVAATGGTSVRCGAGWFRRQLQGEAKGAVVHELVHVVQQYGRVRRSDPNATRTPGWLVEGIADYIRWFLYEPETRGAEVTSRNIARARYDSSYRISGNFLNWVTETYDKNIVRKLNAAARQGRYKESLWKEATGRTVQQLGDEWKKSLQKKIAAQAVPADEKK